MLGRPFSLEAAKESAATAAARRAKTKAELDARATTVTATGLKLTPFFLAGGALLLWLMIKD